MAKLGKENHDRIQRANDREAVGATPLSSSSLNNYGYEASSRDYTDGLMTPQPLDKTANSGLMNFIFGGSAAPSTTTVARKRKPRIPSAGTDDAHPPSVVHLPQVPDTMLQTDFPASDRERVEMEVIKSLVESYFSIVRKNFVDMVPKVCVHGDSVSSIFVVCAYLTITYGSFSFHRW
jgi:hypothetical protein